MDFDSPDGILDLTCNRTPCNTNQACLEHHPEGEKVGMVKSYGQIYLDYLQKQALISSLDELETRSPNALVTGIPDHQLFSIGLPTQHDVIQSKGLVQISWAIDSMKGLQIVYGETDTIIPSVLANQIPTVPETKSDIQPIVSNLSRKGKRWSTEEDATLQQEMDDITPDGCTLIEYVEMHNTLSQIAEKHGRTIRAIKFRLLYLAHRTILKKLKVCSELSFVDGSSELSHGDLFSRCAVPILENMYALTKLEYLEYIQSNPKEMEGVNQYLQ
jgi:hypothetical protein